MKPLIPLFILAVLFASCNNESANKSNVPNEPKRDTVDYKAVIQETDNAFAAAALRADSASFVTTFYHPDAAVYPPNGPEMDAKKMASMVTQFPKMGVSSFTLTAKEIYEGDETITEVGRFEMGDGSKTIDKGKYMVVWKKDGDKWKLFRDIWNSDNPPPTTAKK